MVEEVLRDASSDGSGMTWSASGGRPSVSPARWRISIARVAQRAARAEGRKITALRVLAATIDLNSAVEVGFVIGSSASTTPIGSATYWIDAFGVLVDHADGALVAQVVVEELGGDVVLGHLVLEYAEAGLFERELGELDGGLQSGDDHRADDPVDLLLIADRAERDGGGLGALHDAVPAGNRRGLGGVDGGGHRSTSATSRERRASESSSARKASASGCGSSTTPASVRKPAVSLPA